MNTSTSHLCNTLILFCLFTFSSCTEDFDDCFYLTDEVVTNVYPLENFNQLETFVPGEYTLKQGVNHSIEITGHPRYLDSLRSQVYNERLSISNRFAFCENNTQVKVVITLPKIKEIFIDAKSKVTIDDFENQEDLNIILSKKSILDFNRFKGVNKLQMLLRDDSIITSNTPMNVVDSLKVMIEGDGRLNGFNIPANNVAISILGKGYCEVNAIKKLNVVIKGDADVVSKGMPLLYKRITGRGDVYFKN